MGKQPLNEAYHNEVLEAYQKISDIFHNFTHLIRERIDFQHWPRDLQKMVELGCDPPGTKFLGFDKRPEMWPVPDFTEHTPNRYLISRIEDFGRAKAKLEVILDDEIFNKSAFDPYWTHENEEFDKRLDEIRVKLHCLEDNLWDLMQVLRNEGPDLGS